MKNITDQEFKRTVLLGIQVMSTHMCALALGSKVPNPNFGKPMSNVTDAANPTGKQKDKRVFVPMSHENQMYHSGSQYHLNTMIDQLVGTDEEEVSLAPQAVALNETVPDNVTEIGSRERGSGSVDPDPTPDGTA